MKSVTTAEKTAKKAPVAAKKAAPRSTVAPKRARAVKNSPIAHGVGRRKSCVARVWLRRGKGNFVVNGKEVNTYFDTEPARIAAVAPLMVFQQAQGYDIDARVVGGGLCGQADAVKLGVARAILALHEDVRPLYRHEGLLTVDSRLKERKKYGQKGARRKFQFVKR